MKKLIGGAFVAIVVFVTSIGIAATASSTTLESDLTLFAESLSESEGVSVETAKRIIVMSPAIADLAERLHDVPGFGGLWLNWTPEVSLSVAFQSPNDPAVDNVVREADLPADLPVNLVK